MPSQGSADDALLRLDGLSVRFPARHGEVHAVRQVSLQVEAGECLGIVGESGSGKSTLCAAILSLLPAGTRLDGRILLGGRDLLRLSRGDLAGVRGREVAMIFQDPVGALNPVRRIGAQIADKLIVHKGLSRTAARAEAARLLDLVRVPAARQRLDDYPHHLSGGLCQRVMIAMALSCAPRLLLADEPTTALDATIQAQILCLLEDLGRAFGMAIILVSHDLGVVARLADRIAVMYAGEVVEEAPAATLIGRPRHPYTQGLIQASPRLEASGGLLAGIPGTVASPAALPAGCAFAPRCRRAEATCRTVPPPLSFAGDARVACHFPVSLH